eukprot:scaffold5248_cov123-Isochrysis_galbana.AAC.2
MQVTAKSSDGHDHAGRGLYGNTHMIGPRGRSAAPTRGSVQRGEYSASCAESKNKTALAKTKYTTNPGSANIVISSRNLPCADPSAVVSSGSILGGGRRPVALMWSQQVKGADVLVEDRNKVARNAGYFSE